MTTKENLILSGKLKLVLTDSKGNIKEERNIKNLIVNTGIGHITSRMTAASAGVMSHMALGSGSSAAAAGDTALGSQLGSRVAFTSATRSGSNNESIIYIAQFGAGAGTGAVTEAGIFNASSSGTMLCRTVFSVVNKGSGDTLQVTWTVTLAAS